VFEGCKKWIEDKADEERVENDEEQRLALAKHELPVLARYLEYHPTTPSSTALKISGSSTTILSAPTERAKPRTSSIPSRRRE